MRFYQGGGRRALPSMAYSRPGAAQMGLLSDELWPVPQFVSTGGGFAGRRKPTPEDEQVETGEKPAEADGDDEPTGLPASVIKQYREKLDQEGQDYLARGPRSFEEQLAYAQQVRPNAYENSRPASAEDQLRFKQERVVDWANNFVGPDGIVYVRDHWLGEEKPEARIFRAYEDMVGGFKRPKLDDLLNQFDLPDRLEGYSPETKAKIADIESFDRPLSADQAAWQAWAREQGVNPATWFMAERLPDFDQTNYQLGDNRDVPPVVSGSTFVGPDGFFYRHTNLTRPDRSTQINQALEHQRAMEALRDAPPDFWELLSRVYAAGGGFPGPYYGRGYLPRSTYDPALPQTLRSEAWSEAPVRRVPNSQPILPAEAETVTGANGTGAIAKKGRSNTTRFGVKRDANADWISYRDLWDQTGYEGILSAANRAKIDAGKSPVVDEEWVTYFPEDAGLLGQTIQIHHIGGLGLTVPWPYPRHIDAHVPGGFRWNTGGPGSAVPFYPRRQPPK